MPVFPDLDHDTWFEAHTETIVAKCKRTATSVPGVTDRPFVFYVPGGDDKYPGFWIRDAFMQCRSGFIYRETMETILQVILSNLVIPKEDGRWYGPSATLHLEAFRRLSSCG